MYILITYESQGSFLRNAYNSGGTLISGTKTTTKKISVLLGSLVIIMMLLYGPSIVVNSLASSPLSYKANTSGDNSTNGTQPKDQQNQQSFSIQPCDKTHPCVSSTGPT